MNYALNVTARVGIDKVNEAVQHDDVMQTERDAGVELAIC